MGAKTPDLLDFEDSVLIRVLRHLPSPTDVWKLASCSAPVGARLRTPIVSNELCMHFFQCPSMLEVDDSSTLEVHISLPKLIEGN